MPVQAFPGHPPGDQEHQVVTGGLPVDDHVGRSHLCTSVRIAACAARLAVADGDGQPPMYCMVLAFSV